MDGAIWRAGGDAAVSYPDEGNDACFAIEEQSYWFRHRNRCLVAVLRRLPPPGVLLDVGGGNGFVTRALEAAGFPAALLEPGPRGIDNARDRGLAPVVHSTFERAGFSPDSLAAVGMFDVLEHLPHDRAALAYAASRLRAGGRIYLTVPAFAWLWSEADVHAGHFRRYRLGELIARLRAEGLVPEYATYLFACLAVPLFVLRTLPSRLGLRTNRHVENARREHTSSGRFARLIEASLEREVARVERGLAVRCGTSCLVVARRPAQ